MCARPRRIWARLPVVMCSLPGVCHGRTTNTYWNAGPGWKLIHVHLGGIAQALAFSDHVGGFEAGAFLCHFAWASRLGLGVMRPYWCLVLCATCFRTCWQTSTVSASALLSRLMSFRSLSVGRRPLSGAYVEVFVLRHAFAWRLPLSNKLVMPWRAILIPRLLCESA